MKKEMLINVLQPEECRIAILEDGVLEELYVERTSHESYTGNLYKGRIVNLEPAIQAAFVDFSVGRNGFLHVSDVEPQYYRKNLSDQAELSPRDRDREREPRRDRAPEAREREPRRDRAPRAAEDREPPASGGFGEGIIDPPRRDRPDRSERGRRDRSEPRRFGEGLEGEESPAPKRPAEADRFAPDEPPRRLRSEVPPPPATRAVESPYLRTPPPDRDEPVVERSPYSRRPTPAPAPPPAPVERDEPAAERPRNPAAGFVRPSEPEPFDPDLPPSRTQRSRPAAPRPIEDEVKPRAALDPRDAEPEPETPAAREPRRGRGRGRSRPAVEAEPPASFEPAAEADAPDFDFAADSAPEEASETPRRRGGRDAIRSRGGDRPQPPAAERSRPAPPAPPAVDRPRPFAADLEEPRPQPTEPEWARTAVPEKTRSYAPDHEADRPQPTAPERSRPTPPAERGRGFAADLDIDRPAPPAAERSRPAPPAERPRPASPERGRGFAADLDIDRPAPPAAEPGRERGRAAAERPRASEFEPPAREPRSKPHDRAGEEGYIPRRLRHGGAEAESVVPPAWPDLSDDEELTPGVDSDEEGEAGEEAEGSTAREGGRRRRRRRGRRRDRDAVDRAPAPEADVESDEIDDLADPEDFDPSVPARREAIEAHGSDLDDLTSTADFDFGDDHEHDEFDEDEDEGGRAPRAARVSDPEDQIDPELEEEIRKEIEEIAELEREMGLRGTVEARPRRGDDAGKGGVRGRGTVKPPIQEIFRRGDEVLIQVIKESIGTKGPTLSTYISIPGRYLVLMPGLNRVGVSRKIADEGQRRKLREIMTELNPPKGLGFIVRTAGLDRSKRELARDLAYLLRLWKVILRRIKKAKSPAPIYQESDMITRTIRDIFTSEIDTIWIDEPSAFERAQEFLRVVMPRFVDRLKLYDEKVPLFHKYGIEDEIAKIQRRRVDLPEGGSIVIDQTEALVAIDVNSGNFRVENDAERTAYEMNLRAAKEIARQLRLRDLGGVIVNDFIDMRDEKNRRGVEHALRDAIKRDRARTKVLRMSQFGLIEMTRQRIRPSLKRSVYEDCSHCAGAGVVKTTESMSIDVMRILALASHREEIRRVNIGVHPGVAVHLNNRKRKEIARIELEANMTIHIRHEADAPAEHLQVDCFDANNNEVRLFPAPPPERHHHHRRGSH